MAYKKKNNRPPRPGEGRPTKYNPKYCQEIIKFFDVPHFAVKNMGKRGKVEIANPLPFFSGFARKIDVSIQVLHDWNKAYPEFLEAYTRAKALQHEMLHVNCMKGLYDARYGIFAAKNMTDWRDKIDIDQTVEVIERKVSVPELTSRLQILLGK